MGERGGTYSERLVTRELRGQLGPKDSIVTSLRFSDPRHGDVEADVVLLLADAGVAVVEIKGGTVEYRDGEWTTTRPGYSRRTHPIEQARRAKHALRRYLDRQPEWSHGLIHAEWFVVLPQTPVDGDFGPEGLQSRLIGAGQMPGAVEQMRRVLTDGLGASPALPAEWADETLSLLLRRRVPEEKTSQRKKWVMLSGAAAAILLAGAGIAFSLLGRTTPPDPARSGTAACSANYEPCVPEGPDLDCPEIGFRVEVVGTDVYGLDRDRDGIACETMGSPTSR